MKKTLAAVLLAMILAAFLPPGAFAQAAVPAPAAGVPRAGAAGAANLPVPFVDLNVRTARSNQEVVLSVQLLLLLTVLALAPSILILTTCFPAHRNRLRFHPARPVTAVSPSQPGDDGAGALPHVVHHVAHLQPDLRDLPEAFR